VTTVAILSPGFADSPGGVTDHTSRVVARWRVRGATPHVLQKPAELGRDSRPVLVQYVPFLYGRRGLAPGLGRAVRRAREAGARVTLFVHEPWVPPTRLPWLVLSPLQRRQLRRLARLSDAVVTPVPAWRALLPGPVDLLYVGSTLGPPPEGAGGPDLAAPVVFSPFAAGLAWPWILAAAAAIGATPPLVVLGATHAEAVARGLPLPADAATWDWRGRLPGPEALTGLARARLVLAPYVDGLTGRRTAALAALSTGSRVASARGPLSDPVFEAGPVALADHRTAYADLARDLWMRPDSGDGHAVRRRWFAEHFDPDRLDDRLLAIVLGSAA
jgi:hypothetical protein